MDWFPNNTVGASNTRLTIYPTDSSWSSTDHMTWDLETEEGESYVEETDREGEER